MYVCVCKAVSSREVEAAIDEGACDIDALSDRLGVATGCGGCAPVVETLLETRLGAARARRPPVAALSAAT